MQPLVSIIIPTFNATNRLDRAISSALNQTYNNIEIIVVDDNNPNSDSRIFTELVLDKYKTTKNIFYIKHDQNKNGAAARNTGINASHGDMIAFLDDDDEYLPNRIERCVDALLANKEYDAVYTGCLIFLHGTLLEKRKPIYSGFVWKELLLNEGLLGSGSNIFIKRSCLSDAPSFDVRFLRYQDVEFMLRALQKHKLLALNSFLVNKNIEKRNVPEYPKYKANKELIFKTFDYLITRLSDEEKRVFFSKQYLELLNSAIISNNKIWIKEAKHNLLKYSKIDVRTKIKCALPWLYIWHTRRNER